MKIAKPFLLRAEMTPERWQQLEELFQSRFEREADKWALLETPLIAKLLLSGSPVI